MEYNKIPSVYEAIPIESQMYYFLVKYEIESNDWWLCRVSNKWIQGKIGKYFAWKVLRKMKQLKRVKLRKEVLKDSKFLFNFSD